MGDLISRKAVMDYLREQQANVIIEQNKENYVTYEATKGMLSSVDAFMNFIVQLPTAYDADKVAETLSDEYISAICENCKPCNLPHTIGCCYDKAIGKAIEIVKEGAVKDE